MSKTVLIVEDDSLNMKLLNDLLEFQGYTIIQQNDGLGAYEAICEHRPDLVLMDIQLPGRSGLDITEAMKSNVELKHIPVIAVTAFTEQQDKQDCLNHGCDGYIAKPISIYTFFDTVSEFTKDIKQDLRIVH